MQKPANKSSKRVSKKTGNMKDVVEKPINRSSKSFILPLLPLRDVVAFPGMTLPLFVGREKSIQAIKATNEYILLVSQKDALVEDPTLNDLYEIGIIAKIKQAITLPDNTIKILVEGESLARLQEIIKIDDADHICVKAQLIETRYVDKDNEEQIALRKTLRAMFDQYMKTQKKYSAELAGYVENITDSFKLAYIIATHMEMKSEQKQKVLEEFDATRLIERMLQYIESEMEILQAERRIRSRIKAQIEKNQKEYYLNEQMKAIQKELGEVDDAKEEIYRFEMKIDQTHLSESAKIKAKAELKKLKYMNPLSAEASVIRNYLDFLLSLPWGKHTHIETDLQKVREMLEHSHYGMKKAKERIYELIVQHKRVQNISRSPVLCFHGAPGTGKTSLAHAAGQAMGLKTMRIPLGGVRDEAVLRGHRRTYIGSMPGKIMQAVKDAQSSNLLIIFDEIGAMGNDWRGNPEDVLLEVFDPVQNKAFQDHYVEEGFDLSGVIFMCTTNTLNLKPALLDRLEIIEVSGYAQEEKHMIAQDYIIPKLKSEYGIKAGEFKIGNAEIDKVIREYTYEAGVRGLEQKLAQLIRKTMCAIEESKNSKNGARAKPKAKATSHSSGIKITNKEIKEFLGHPTYTPEQRGEKPEIGIATGLAYVEKREGQEGEVLYIEAKMVPGNGKVECTGRLGDVMKESAEVAFKYLLANATKYKIDLSVLKEKNIHIHLPSGAVPKDGPSAGVAMFCAMLSAVQNVPIRSDIAITGEISLYKVLKVGGIKEKILAAYRRTPKINTIFLPHDNINDLDEISQEIKNAMEIIPIKSVDEVIKKVFIK